MFQEDQDEEDEIAYVNLDSPQEINEWLAKRIYGQKKGGQDSRHAFV